jgi:fluoroacetyl-CoA thioesterase
MKNIFEVGDQIKIERLIEDSDVAAFNGEVVHKVCSTFALAREIEWSSRQFVLKMREEDEEGIGTMLTIDHKAPAFVGEIVEVMAEIESIVKNEIICTYEAKVGARIIATGKTGQKVLKKEAINHIFSKFGQR